MRHPASGDCIEWLRREVEQGISQLWHCSDGVDEAYAVTRLDHNPTEWVICYFEGAGMRKFGAHFVEVARRKGWRLRAHTQRPGVVRLLRPLGLKVTEMVLRT